MFLPTTREEMSRLGWPELDVILVTGDAYIDSPFIGVALIGKALLNAGFRVGVIGQPDTDSGRDISRLGEPSLFWGVSAGCMDSMVANYTATKKPRRRDDLTAGGVNNRRPDMAVIVYCNIIRRYFKRTRPIVIGGIEAGLRRISHYDYWKNKVRRSILFDARADILVYGMGETTVCDIAERLKNKQPADDLRGTCVIQSEPPEGYVELPGHTDAAKDKAAFHRMFRLFYENNDPFTAKGLFQKQDTRYLVQNPPGMPMRPEELDRIYEMDFERDVHPRHENQGRVPGIETFRFAITTHRGCFGQCNFCGISAHQGRAVVSRSPASLIREAETLTRHLKFKGIIHDVGGPTANMYGMSCGRMRGRGVCDGRRCLTPAICPKLGVNHARQIDLLKRIRELPNVRKVFIGSGIRHDLVVRDKKHGEAWLENVIRHHVSGQLKLAPEHCSKRVLKLMGKPGIEAFETFKQKYDRINKRLGKKQFLSCYFIAAYPGCATDDMREAQRFARQTLKFRPEQVQIFTPAPSTPATMMYYTETDLNGTPLFVEKGMKGKEAQKRVLTGSGSGKNRKGRQVSG